jgi:sulfite reductase (NADPH) flavoprotein alpha-component
MSVSIIPESAPFSPEQRAWLNGFLAGWLGLQEAAGAPGPAVASPITPPATATVPAAAVEDHPWHDSALSLDERLKLAEGRPLPHKLMAAMAQLDCGACGYVCKTYSEALASGSESSLSLCAPGGSETSRTLKRLMKERPATNGAPAAEPNGVAAKPVGTRQNPYTAAVLRSDRLNRPGSEKAVHHVEIDLNRSGLSYKVGDALGVYPTNCGELVDALLAELGATSDEPAVREALTSERCLAEIPDGLLALLADSAADAGEAEQLRALINGDGPEPGLDVLDLLRRFPSARPAPAEFVGTLARLKPRLYSISSSPKKHARQVHLTVGRVCTTIGGRARKGVASTMLADRVQAGSPLRVFVQPSHGFTIPEDPSAPLIMIGPGTGIAPFRAFLHERDCLGASGKSWLFFGDQRSAFDFLYEDELSDLAARGVLTRLDLAFSRDGAEKVYVQHKILEHGAAVYDWLEQGAFVFVCGDARRMAPDVDRALRAVIRDHGAMDDDSAAAYLSRLSASGRYCRDVY